MGITDWKITLYPNEEEDEITRLRRDEMEVNLAQRMQMLGYKPELMEEGERDVRFTYKKIDEQAQPQMPMGGGMPMRGGMPPNAPGRNAVPPGMGMGAIMPPSQPGGEGQGIRTPRSPARPQQRSSGGIGSPISNVQQRGLPPTIPQQNSASIDGFKKVTRCVTIIRAICLGVIR